jgi:hypothetical protein
VRCHHHAGTNTQSFTAMAMTAARPMTEPILYGSQVIGFGGKCTIHLRLQEEFEGCFSCQRGGVSLLLVVVAAVKVTMPMAVSLLYLSSGLGNSHSNSMGMGFPNRHADVPLPSPIHPSTCFNSEPSPASPPAKLSTAGMLGRTMPRMVLVTWRRYMGSVVPQTDLNYPSQGPAAEAWACLQYTPSGAIKLTALLSSTLSTPSSFHFRA